MWCRAVLACLLLASSAWAWGAPALATVTILDGSATLIRDSAKLSLVEGTTLAKDDIIETGGSGRFVRLEFTDGVILDLGPDTGALLAPKLSGDRGKLPVKVYLRQGWAKVTLPASGTTAAAGAFASPMLDVTGVSKHLVVSSRPGQVFAFAESGEVTLEDRRKPKSSVALTLRSDDFLTLSGAERPAVGTRPSQAFMQSVPRAFLDTIPPRAARFKGANVNPKPVGEIAYDDAQPWVDAEPPLRGQFLTRWKPLAQVPDFRKGLVAGLRAHPEWDRVLYPEKYLPKPVLSPAPASTTPPPASSR